LLLAITRTLTFAAHTRARRFCRAHCDIKKTELIVYKIIN
jgi:hypothetical protein